ncbi:MAG: FAD-binding oxidoreductase [Bacteroidetes bacterium]|nr:FAD-binding oxidoreductase [Bacteroidota bacterium]
MHPFQLSYWEQKSFFSNIDLLVVGSGIVGLNAAWAFKKRQPSANVLVIEKSFLPYGASTRNAGFACFGSLSELIEDKKTMGEKAMFDLVEKRIRGLDKLRKNLGDESIGYKHYGGYELFRKSDFPLYESCLNEMQYFNESLEKYTQQKSTFEMKDASISHMGFAETEHMLWNNAEGQIDTGMMMNSLLSACRNSGIQILNGISIERFDGAQGRVSVLTDAGFEFSVKKLIITTNAFAKDLLPELEVEPARAQVLITAPIPNLNIKGCFHFDRGYYYFRNIDNRILFGGARNSAFEDEATTYFGITQTIQHKLEHILAETILPNTPFTIENRWSGIMGLGPKKGPIVKAISANVFCAVRMSGMGVAIGSEIGEDVAKLASN